MLEGRIQGGMAVNLLPASDDRGDLFELITARDGATDPLVHAYQVFAAPGSIRAWVVHRNQTDRLRFTEGSFRIVLCDLRSWSPTARNIVTILAGAGAHRHEDPDKCRLPSLRVSIASVLAQTCADFEILVIGDCCSDDSAEVALSFADPRIRWHNLPVRHKTQSGPNNYGISIASGSLIAYLGHDDVWHPCHLASLLETRERTGAEIACGVTVMYGPPGSGIRGVTGIFVEGRHRSDDFVPPSAILHHRSLSDTIGPWRRPEETSAPVDHDFLTRACESGARLVSTERLTVFKFNSAWRRDSYFFRDAGEQRRMLDRLTSDPARCVEEEWAGLRRFLLDDQPSAMDWHGVEQSPEYGSFRWSGPSPAAGLTLPVQVPPRFRLRLMLLNWYRDDIAAGLKLLAAGLPVEFTCRRGDGPAVFVEAIVSLPQVPSGPLRLRLEVARLHCPYFDSGRTRPDQRWLGVCVAWIELEPLPPEG